MRPSSPPHHHNGSVATCHLWTVSGGVHALLVLEQTECSTSNRQRAIYDMYVYIYIYGIYNIYMVYIVYIWYIYIVCIYIWYSPLTDIFRSS